MTPAQKSTTRGEGPIEAKPTTLPSLLTPLPQKEYEAQLQEPTTRTTKMVTECTEVAAEFVGFSHLIPPHVQNVRDRLAQMAELFDEADGEIDCGTEFNGTTPVASDSDDASDIRVVPEAELNLSEMMARLDVFKGIIDQYEEEKLLASSTYVPELADEAREFLEEKGEFWNESWPELCKTEDGAHAIKCISVRTKDQHQYGSVYGLAWEFGFDPRLNGNFQQEWHSPHAEPGGRWRKVPDYSEYHEANRVLEETGEQIEFTLPIPFQEPEDPIKPTEFVSVDHGKKNLRALMLTGKHKTLKRVLKSNVCKEKNQPEIYELYSKAVKNLE